MNSPVEIPDLTGGALIDFDPGRRVLLLAFAGQYQQIGIPIFEFRKICSEFKQVNQILLRDSKKLWYHQGLPEAGDSIADIVSFLKKYLRHPATERTVIFGNSGGAYAALLFGSLLQADEVHAFSPKSFLTPWKRIMIGDYKLHSGLAQLVSLQLRGEKKYFDLIKILEESAGSAKNYHVYYSRDHKIDRWHACRLETISGVQLHPFPCNTHNLISLLKENGQLRQIIKKALEQ